MTEMKRLHAIWIKVLHLTALLRCAYFAIVDLL